ncbi:MAG TPA: PAS domain S-box protein, partial [Cytophagales bacterium]
ANVQALLDTSPQAYFMLGRQYEILKWNAVGEKYIRMIWGKTVREGDSMLWYSNPADEADFRKDFALAMAGEKVEIEKGITYPNGVQIWYEIKYLPIHNREGQPYAVAFSAVDITARKQNELALQKLSLVAQQTDNAVIITDRAGVTEWVNEGFTRITGYAPGEAIGKTPGALLQGPSPDPALTAFMRERITAGEGFKTEIINYHKNGTPYWLALSVSPLRNADGAVTGFIAIESDVTERKKLEEETRRSLATLQAVQESTHDIIFALDCHYCYLSFNSVHARTMQAIFGITIRRGMNVLAIMAHLPDGAREKDRLDRALAGEQYTVEDAFGDHAHERRYYEVSYNPIRNADGRVHGVAIFSQDITGRKRAEREREQLLRELQNYKRVLDASALISITDAEGRITYVNDLFCNTTGYGPGELLGQTHRLVNAGYHPKSFFAQLWSTILAGKLWRGEICNRSKSGKHFWVDTIIYPITDANGTITQFICTRYEITKRKLGEERIRKSELALKEAQSVARIGSWEYDVTAGLLHFSDEVYNILAWDKAQGPPSFPQALALCHPDDAVAYGQLVRRAIQKGQAYHTDIRVITPGGEEKYVNMIGRPQKGKNGKVFKLTGTVMDVDLRKRSEKKLEAQKEQRLKTNRERDRFVYSAGHDLRAPLMSMLGLTDIIAEEADPAQRDYYLELMRRSIHQLDHFIQDIIHFSRNQRTAVAREPVDVAQLVDQAWEGLRYLAAGQAVRLEKSVQAETVLRTDPKRLSVILNNLLSNAVRYGDPGKEEALVRVAVCITPREARITVADNGIGIGVEHLDKIFGMFYRATETKAGSGLGLYIVKETVDA